jgi:predicted amidophosphoribosyltransferase
MLSLCRCHNRQHGIIVIRFGLKELVQTARDILFPLRCLDCGAGLPVRREVSFCDICLQNVRLIHEPFCTICGTPFDKAAGESHRCGVCLKKSWHFMQARAVVRYEGAIAEALKSFKYRGKTHGLATFAALAEDYFHRYPRPLPDIILPVRFIKNVCGEGASTRLLFLAEKFSPRKRKG